MYVREEKRSTTYQTREGRHLETEQSRRIVQERHFELFTSNEQPAGRHRLRVPGNTYCST
jgi:hypothetical protein